MKTNDRKKRERFWAGHFDAWERAGISQAQYCRDYGLNMATFQKWKSMIWKEKIKAHVNVLDMQDSKNCMVYSIMWAQFSPIMQSKFESLEN